MPVIGETIRIDHGDKVVERYIISVSETYVRSRSRWISGTPYEGAPSNYEWGCTPEAWKRHIEQNRSIGKLLEHRIPSPDVPPGHVLVTTPPTLWTETLEAENG
jgi:hypothetical protein